MKFVILGSGTSVPHAQRSSSGYWLETQNGSLLLDCGASAVHRIAQEKLDWANLDAIWISHFHLDHVGGLAPFLFGTKYAPETQYRKKPLCIFGAKEESLAIHIRNENDKTLVYTADTGFTKDLGTLALGVDLLVMECSFFKNKPVETHLELAEAIYLARYAKPKKVILTHLYPEWDNVDFLKEVEKLSPLCEVIEAKDGSRLEIIGEREQITENNLR
ncbi:MAG: MBL fold metallo-hydrolase [Acidobacteria bacterium]|nr:MBL fold metallo-hydrolase [Acidobacteriota bacterium]